MGNRLSKKICYWKVMWLGLEFLTCFNISLYFNWAQQGFESDTAVLLGFLPLMIAWVYFIFWNSLLDIIVKYITLLMGYLVGAGYHDGNGIYDLLEAIQWAIATATTGADLVVFSFIIMLNWFLGRWVSIKLDNLSNLCRD